MDRTELVRNNGNSLQPAAYLRCPIDLCSGDENGILDSDQVTEMGLRATVIDSRTGDTYPIELSQRTRQAEAEVQYSLEWSGQNGIVVQIFPELIFEEIAPEEYLSEASGSYVTSGEAVFRSWDDNYSQQSALIVLADLADAPTGEATITLSADGLNFRQSFVAIVDYDGSLIVGLKGLDL